MKNVNAKVKGKELFRNYFSFIGLILVVIIFHVLTEGRLISSRNLMNIFNNFFSIGLGAIGVMFLMSLGELDLSVGAIMGFSAAIGALSAQANASQKRCSTAASCARVAVSFGARALPPTPKISSCATAHCIGPTAYALMPP